MKERASSEGVWSFPALGALCAIGLVACGGAEASTDASAEQSAALRVEVGNGVIAFEAFGRENMIHGIAGDSRFVFVTEPLHGRVAVHDRLTGREIGFVPPPPDGWLLPFTMRIVNEGRLVVLDAGGFPNPGTLTIPRVYDYDYRFDRRTRTFSATLVRSVKFDSVPMGFTEDVEVLADGTYVVSDSILGSIWLIRPDGSIAPGIVPESFERPVPATGPCIFTGQVPTVDGLPFALVGNFAPGVGSMATDGQHLYYGNSCLGGIHRVPLASLSDTTRPPHQRGDDAELVSPGVPGAFEVMKGLAFNQWNPDDRRLYVLDALHLRLIRVNVTTGSRKVLADDRVLFNLPVSTAFLPTPGGVQSLVVASDQEHRFAAINQGIPADMLQPPFLVTKVLVTD